MPPKKRATSKTYPDTQRIKLGASTHLYTVAEFRAMLMEAADFVEAAGVTHVDPANLYVPLRDAKGQSITRIRGQPLEMHVIPGPYRSAADEHGV